MFMTISLFIGLIILVCMYKIFLLSLKMLFLSGISILFRNDKIMHLHSEKMGLMYPKRQFMVMISVFYK